MPPFRGTGPVFSFFSTFSHASLALSFPLVLELNSFCYCLYIRFPMCSAAACMILWILYCMTCVISSGCLCPALPTDSAKTSDRRRSGRSSQTNTTITSRSLSQHGCIPFLLSHHIHVLCQYLHTHFISQISPQVTAITPFFADLECGTDFRETPLS